MLHSCGSFSLALPGQKLPPNSGLCKYDVIQTHVVCMYRIAGKFGREKLWGEFALSDEHLVEKSLVN